VLQRGAVRCSVLCCIALCCSLLQFVAVCCSMSQYVAVCCSVLLYGALCYTDFTVLQYFVVCHRLLQCVAVPQVLAYRCVGHRHSNTPHHMCCSLLQSVAVCCSLLQSVAVCCRVFQCVAVWAYGIPTFTHSLSHVL